MSGKLYVDEPFTCDACGTMEKGFYASAQWWSLPVGWFVKLTAVGPSHFVCSLACAKRVDEGKEKR